MVVRNISIEVCDNCGAPPNRIMWDALAGAPFEETGAWHVVYDCGRRQPVAEGSESQCKPIRHASPHAPCRNIDVGVCSNCGAPPTDLRWDAEAFNGAGAWHVVYECESRELVGAAERCRVRPSLVCLMSTLALLRQRLAELEARGEGSANE